MCGLWHILIALLVVTIFVLGELWAALTRRLAPIAEIGRFVFRNVIRKEDYFSSCSGLRSEEGEDFGALALDVLFVWWGATLTRLAWLLFWSIVSVGQKILRATNPRRPEFRPAV